MSDDQTTPQVDGDESAARTPEWWLERMACALQDRRFGRSGNRIFSRTVRNPSRIRPGLELLNDYLVGDPPLIGYAEGWGDHFRRITRLGRLNMAELIINSKSARMSLRGFRTAAAGDEYGDQQARKIMRANKLKLVAREVHDLQLWAADGYAMVTPPQGDEIPVITAEDPRQTITVHDPATGQTLAALKLFRDEWDAADFAHLYIRVDANTVTHYSLINEGATSLLSRKFRMGTGWQERDTPLDLPRMPIVRFPNRGHRGEYERHLDTLDRINDQIMDKVVIAKVQAFRQMVLKGLPDKELVVENGVPKEVAIDYSDAFVAEPGSLWKVPKDVDIWESQTTDLGPLRLSIKDDLMDLAAGTQTSLPAITPDAAQGSAEGASLMREEEVFAVEACRDYAEAGWAEVMSTAFAFMGDTVRSDISQMEPMWGPVERYSLAEKADAASKAPTTLPREAIQTDIWQYDPADIPRLREQAGHDLLTAGPPPAAPAAPGGVPAVTFTAPTPPAPDSGNPSAG